MYCMPPPNARPFSPKALCMPLTDVITVAEGRGWNLQSSGSNNDHRLQWSRHCNFLTAVGKIKSMRMKIPPRRTFQLGAQLSPSSIFVDAGRTSLTSVSKRVGTTPGPGPMAETRKRANERVCEVSCPYDFTSCCGDTHFRTTGERVEKKDCAILRDLARGRGRRRCEVAKMIDDQRSRAEYFDGHVKSTRWCAGVGPMVPISYQTRQESSSGTWICHLYCDLRLGQSVRPSSRGASWRTRVRRVFKASKARRHTIPLACVRTQMTAVV